MQSLSYFGSHRPAHSPFLMSRLGGCRCVYTQTEKKNKSRSQTPAAKDASKINSVVSAPIHVQKTLMFPSPERGLFLSTSWSYTLGAEDAIKVTESSVPSNLLFTLLQVWIWTTPCRAPIACLSRHFLSLRFSVTTVVKGEPEPGSCEWKHCQIWPHHPQNLRQTL